MPVSINQLPVIRYFDMTKKSPNQAITKDGSVIHPDQLQSDLIPDGKLGDADLAVVETEVNTRQRKISKSM